MHASAGGVCIKGGEGTQMQKHRCRHPPLTPPIRAIGAWPAAAPPTVCRAMAPLPQMMGRTTQADENRCHPHQREHLARPHAAIDIIQDLQKQRQAGRMQVGTG